MKTELENIIPVGKENAIHLDALASLLQVSPDKAKSMVRMARQQGSSIISGSRGYWFSDDENEKRTFVNLMHKQAFSRLQSCSPIKHTLDMFDGQINLSEVLRSTQEDSNEQK